MKLTRTVIAAALTGLLTVMISACSSSDGESAPPTTTSNVRQTYVLATPTPSQPPASTSDPAEPAATATAAVPASSLRYQKIREPFSRPGECNENGSTLEMTACVLEQVIDVDSTVDALQLKRFEQAKDAKRAGILAEYASWQKGRTTTCAKTATSGGSIDQVIEAQCLLKVSQQRVETLNDVS